MHADGPRFDPWIEHIFIILNRFYRHNFYIYNQLHVSKASTMILKQLTSSIRYITNTLRARFSSQHHEDSHSQRQDKVQTTKFNPYAQKDLRGFENFHKLNENQKSYSPIHSDQYQPLTAYGVFSKLSNTAAKFIGRWVSHPKSVISSDSLYLPRVYENSVPIYDSIDKASTYLIINKIVSKIVPFNIAFFLPEPSLALLSYGLFYSVYYGTNWKTVRHFVVKMEYLPHTEEIAYQKITIWGGLVTHKVKKSDLEAATLSDIFGEDNYSQKSARGLYNREVVFRIKGSQELLLFDKHGIWNKEGINHEELI